MLESRCQHKLGIHRCAARDILYIISCLTRFPSYPHTTEHALASVTAGYKWERHIVIGYQAENVGPFVVINNKDNFLGISANQGDLANSFLKIVVLISDKKMRFPICFQYKVFDVHLPECCPWELKTVRYKMPRVAHLWIPNLSCHIYALDVNQICQDYH